MKIDSQDIETTEEYREFNYPIHHLLGVNSEDYWEYMFSKESFVFPLENHVQVQRLKDFEIYDLSLQEQLRWVCSNGIEFETEYWDNIRGKWLSCTATRHFKIFTPPPYAKPVNGVLVTFRPDETRIRWHSCDDFDYTYVLKGNYYTQVNDLLNDLRMFSLEEFKEILGLILGIPVNILR